MVNQEPLVANNTNTITMSMRELDRLKVVEAVVEGRLMPWRAAERLDVSRRQVERLVARYRASGPASVLRRTSTSAVNDLGFSPRLRVHMVRYVN
ncbi:hypothetical protein WK95_20035 [Burkholderia ubonensis]|nr:hypothetical protein WK95_20035 [Burkholderia ubonensis]